MSAELYLALFLLALASYVAFLFFAPVLCFTAAIDVVRKVPDGGVNSTCFHVCGPQAALTLNRRPALAQHTCQNHLEIY